MHLSKRSPVRVDRHDPALELVTLAGVGREERQKFGREISPIYFITSNLPPTLIIHGDADKLVPIQQAESFVKRAQDTGAKAKLITKEGQTHGWADMGKDAVRFADWFDEHLRGLKPN